MLLTGIPRYSFKDNRAFIVVDSQGESARLYQGASELGFYFSDTRHLNIWETTYNGCSAVPLAREIVLSGTTAVFSMTNRDFPLLGKPGRIPRDTLMIRRMISLREDTAYEIVEIRNFDPVPIDLRVEQWAGSRFDDVFEVRGFTRARRGRMLPIEEHLHGGVHTSVFQYEGLDGRIRRTFVERHFKTEKIRASPALGGYFTRMEIPPKGTVELRTVVSFDKPSSGRFMGKPFADLCLADVLAEASRVPEKLAFDPLRVESDNAILNRAVQNARTDISMLLTEEGGGLYPYAGIPWFSAPFGRDGLITAYQLLPWSAKVAHGVLDFVFQHLGRKIDPFTEEQPGRVFHELRRGEMATVREVPFIPYYGSVDATPLALILLHEYVRWTKDFAKLREWWPAALAALRWIDEYGDPDKCGFVSYKARSSRGLVNQGWKDSHDSVMHEDGTLAQAPIRLCEVQAYVFRAKLGMSALARKMGDEELARRLRSEALGLRAAFMESFWDEARGFVYLALDGELKPCAVRSSNMGHCLWGQILPGDQARIVARDLAGDSLFNGYGIRTLGDREVAYNPLSYHNGSVWPHDNSLIMEGMRYYGRMEELSKLANGLVDLLEASGDLRMPELFCGFRRRGDDPPVPYEVACKPQAWAAGAVFLLLKSILGLSAEVDESHIVFNKPFLTPGVGTIEIRGLHAADWEMDVRFQRTVGGTAFEVLRKRGNVRVLAVR